MRKYIKRFHVIFLVLMLVLTQPVYAANEGSTDFFSSILRGIQEVFSSITENFTEDVTFSNEDVEGYTSPAELTASPTDYTITFRANGGYWAEVVGQVGDGTELTEAVHNKTITLTSAPISEVDDTQVVDIYSSTVLGNLAYYNDDQSADVRADDADHVIFVGWSLSATGPIIRTRHYTPSSANTELYAQWCYVDDPNATFTVTYNAGIGSFRTSGSNAKTVTKQVKCGSFAPDMVTPYVSDANNSFAGWYLESEAGELPSASDYIMPNATAVYRDMTFTARYAYDDNNTYEYYIKFMANGGTFSNGDQYRLVKVTRDENGVLPDNPTREGFTFNGWSQTASDVTGLLGVFPNPYNGAPDAGDAAQHGADNPFIYYACWTNESTGVTRDVTIKLQPNGGTFGALTDTWSYDEVENCCYQTTTIVNTGTVTVDLNTFPAVSREGYTFKGWSINSSDVYAYQTYNTSYSCNFTAIWQVNNSSADSGDDTPGNTSYTLTFDANGGKWSDGSTSYKMTVASGSSITFPEENPTRDAYKFVGWATTATATEASSFATLRVSGNAKVYAVWALKDVGIPTTVQLVMGDGYYNNKSGTVSIITEIGTAVSQFYSKSKRSGYTLKGFSIDPTSTDVVDKATLVEEDMVLYAVWLEGSNSGDDPSEEEDVTYKIVFNANGGYYDNDPTHTTYTLNVTQGNKIESIPTPKLDNATFKGYGSEINSTATIDFSNLVPEADSTYYAVWDLQATSYTVTFIAGDAYGGSKFSDSLQTKEASVKAGDKVTQPETPLETRSLTFSYWSETKSASWTGTSSVAFDFNSTIKKNTTLYAVYRSTDNSSKFRTVTFDYNGGKLRTKTSLSVDVLYGYPVDKPESPKRKDYTFKGWYTDTAGDSSDKWDFSTGITEDIELYAVWKSKSSSSSSSSPSSSSTTNTTPSNGTSNNAANVTPTSTVTDRLTQQQLANQGLAQNQTSTTIADSESSGSTGIPRTGIKNNLTVSEVSIGILICILCGLYVYTKERDKEVRNEEKD